MPINPAFASRHLPGAPFNPRKAEGCEARAQSPAGPLGSSPSGPDACPSTPQAGQGARRSVAADTAGQGAVRRDLQAPCGPRSGISCVFGSCGFPGRDQVNHEGNKERSRHTCSAEGPHASQRLWAVVEGRWLWPGTPSGCEPFACVLMWNSDWIRICICLILPGTETPSNQQIYHFSRTALKR